MLSFIHLDSISPKNVCISTYTYNLCSNHHEDFPFKCQHQVSTAHNVNRVTMSPRRFQLGTEFIERIERMCASSTAILSHGERQVYTNTCQSPCSFSFHFVVFATQCPYSPPSVS